MVGIEWKRREQWGNTSLAVGWRNDQLGAIEADLRDIRCSERSYMQATVQKCDRGRRRPVVRFRGIILKVHHITDGTLAADAPTLFAALPASPC